MFSYTKINHCVRNVRIRSFSYSVRMRENTDQKNSKYGHFSRGKAYCKADTSHDELTDENIKYTKRLAWVFKS